MAPVKEFLTRTLTYAERTSADARQKAPTYTKATLNSTVRERSNHFPQVFEQSSEVSQAEGFLVAPVKEFLTRTLTYAERTSADARQKVPAWLTSLF